jgi:hypothetical protein
MQKRDWRSENWISTMVSECLVKVERRSQAGIKTDRQYLLIHFLSRKIREYEILGNKNDELDRMVMQSSGETRK